MRSQKKKRQQSNIWKLKSGKAKVEYVVSRVNC